MSQVVPGIFPEYFSNNDVYGTINDLPVSYLEFANHTHTFGRMFGMIIDDQGERDDNDGWVVNSCLRDSLWRTLISVCNQTENILGYNLSPRYHEEVISVSPTLRQQTLWAGISAMNVRQAISGVLRSATLSPYLLQTLTASVIGNYTVVDLDGGVVFNPKEVFLRSSLDGGVIPQLLDPTYPKKVGTTWKVALNTTAHPIQSGEKVHVQSKKYVYVDVDPVTLTTLVPVYLGTTQQIPQARPMQVLLNGKLRYWFYVYTLINPDFYDDTVNLMDGEFYKIQDTIDFRSFTEVATEIRIQENSRGLDSCCITDRAWKAELRVIDAALGVVEIHVLGEWVLNKTTSLEELKDNRPFDFVRGYTYSATINYQTRPDRLPPAIMKDTASVLRAILHRVAADLPAKDCNCEIKRGFIFEQQLSYATNIVTPNGLQLINTKYGNLHGQAVYAELMDKAAKLRVRIV